MESQIPNQNNLQNQNPQPPKQNQHTKLLVGIIIALAAVLIGLGVWFFITTSSQQKALDEAVALKEAAEIDAMQRDLQNASDSLDTAMTLLENQHMITLDDSVKRDLTRKYEKARLQVEELQRQMREQKNLSAAEIKRLKDEIDTLRKLLREYVERINELQIENQNLRNENEQIKQSNEQLSSQVQQTTRQNEVLSQRMTLAEKLNVTGVNLTALKKGKAEKKLSKATQLRVTFTIPQNNSTPVGEKTIYLRIVSPSGQLLGGAGSFSFEGTSLACTARKTVEYAGEEIGGVTMYWDINTALTPGMYTVELFADNYRLASRSFELK